MECDATEDLQAASQSVIVKLVLLELIPEGGGVQPPWKNPDPTQCRAPVN